MSSSPRAKAAHAPATRLRLAIKGLADETKANPFDLCHRLIRDGADASPTAALSCFLSEQQEDERRYWISCLYTSLMSQARRKRLAAFFTPPHLTSYVIDLLARHGVDLTTARILDPACGGAAFLAPIAARLRKQSRESGWSASDLIEIVERGLAGVELEPRLARLAQATIESVLADELRTTGHKLAQLVKAANALTTSGDEGSFDVVVANPPYGRVKSPSSRLLNRWREVLSDSHINTYALFTALALEKVKPGGLVALIIPTSFIGGPYFAALRNYIVRHSVVMSIDVIEKRSDVFLDVTQDACVLLLRKRTSADQSIVSPTCDLVRGDGSSTRLGTVLLPHQASDTYWVLPGDLDRNDDAPFFSQHYTDLEGYGYRVRAGHFVWNRNREKIIEPSKRLASDVPLLWASDIRVGSTIDLDDNAAKRDHVTPPKSVGTVIKRESILVQRTTNRKQARRLNSAVVRGSSVALSGFTSENHTIVIEPISDTPALDLQQLALVLNSAIVDGRFRRVSGTVSISVKALRDLPLPEPGILKASLSLEPDVEAAIARAYRESAKCDDLPLLPEDQNETDAISADAAE